MDTIWDRKSFEVGGHCPLWRGWKKRMTMQNRQKSKAKKTKNKLNLIHQNQPTIQLKPIQPNLDHQTQTTNKLSQTK